MTQPDQIRLRPADLERLAECQASWPSPVSIKTKASVTEAEAPALRRWARIKTAISTWHLDSSVDPTEVFSDLDPVEKQECKRAFDEYKSAIAEYGLDGPEVRFVDPPTPGKVEAPFDLGTMVVEPTVELAEPGQPPAAIRIKTGKRRTSRLESLVLRSNVGYQRDYHEASLGANPQIDDLVAPLSQTELEKLFELRRTLPQPKLRQTNPGKACYRGCTRIPYCEAFRVVDETGSEPRPVPNDSRSIVVSKSALERIAICERSVAWSRLFNFVTPEGDDPSEPGSLARAIGSEAHEMLAASIMGGFSAQHLNNRRNNAIIAAHEALQSQADHRLTYHGVEQTHGLSIVLNDPRGRKTVVSMLASLDAIATEAHGGLAIVEHKTGEGRSQVELDLYAAIAHANYRRLLPPGSHGSRPELAIHHHFLSRDTHDACELTHVDRDRARQALSRLAGLAAKVAAWDPTDALSMPRRAKIDDYCVGCGHAQRCSDF